jgi:pimeloyl-ACP methyl ester carboxylesterase
MKLPIKQIIFIATFSFALFINVSAQKAIAKLEVKITGHGDRSIIFIPGFSCSADVWNETKAKFEGDFTCYAFTMPGFAGAVPEENPSFIAWEKELADYITLNKIKSPIVIGHSMGGGLALALAADYPQLIQKVIVVDALPCLGALMDPTFKSKETNDCSAVVDQMKAMNDEQFYQMQKSTMPSLLADSTKLEQVVSWSVKSDRTTFAKMYCDFSNTDLRDKIKSIKCPTLILLEAYFKNLSPAIEAQYSNLKDVRLQYADKGLHFIMYDDREWYMQQLTDFISEK